ncbi:MAG: tRNA (adenosine(37)-N6)-dimethylallyltransferase MiaA, partial [Deltaproteobacteria bacterium]
VGKTQIGALLAKKLNAEIISCDSMQVYKGMDIITSKPSVYLRNKVVHHLIDTVRAQVPYDVSRYRRDAVKKIRDVLKKGKIPLFVGGTGLYMSVVIDGIFRVKSQNKNIRSSLYRDAQRFGSRYLYEKLKIHDPEAAAKIHPNDTKRIIRALEVFRVTGHPISKLQKERQGLDGRYDVRIFCLNMPRSLLYQRIEKRVDRMFAKGLVKEVKKLLGATLSRTASYAIGIRELKGHFNGEYALDEAKRRIKRNTRLYAKRQLTWFRKDKRIKWVEISGKEKPREIAGRLWKELF